MRQSCQSFGIAVLLIATVSLSYAGDAGIKRWVHGSWVNVRISNLPDSAVITHITANTPVSVRGQQDKSCEIFWDKDQHGFVPCSLLGDKPLTLAEVANESNPNYSPPRAFWIAPSMDALFSAGKHFQKTLLTPQQLAIEDDANFGPPPRLVRYPVPEFEAMKALLAKGVVAGSDRDPPLLTCQQMQDAIDQELQQRQVDRDPLVCDCRVPELPKLRLPKIRPSLFKNSKELSPGNSTIEQLGAHFGIAERGKVIGSPKWESERHMGTRYTGAWDIGKYELTLEKPLIEHVIGRTGLVGAYQWTPQIHETPFGPSEGCAEGLHNKRMGKQLMAGYPKVKDALLWFQSQKALPFKKAKISSRTENIPASKENADKARTERVVIYEIDLNSDGIPDFVQWDIVGSPHPLYSLLRQVFVNINGEWYPFEEDVEGGCT